MKKLMFSLVLMVSSCSVVLACGGATSGFGCGGTGGTSTTTPVDGGYTTGGGSNGGYTGGLYIGTTKFWVVNKWRFNTYTGTYHQCKQNVDLDLANNAVLVSACQKVQ